MCYRWLALVLVLLAVAPALAAEPAVEVRDDASLRAALKIAQPDTHIRIIPGRYGPGVWAANLQGTVKQPIIIEGSDEKNPPLFEGGSEAWHLSDCSCGNGRFEHNLVVFRQADVQVIVNIGPNTRPETFTFADNLWFCEDRPQASQPALPVPESGGVYTVDPRLTAPAENRFQPKNVQAAGFGATAWKPAIPSE